MYLKYSTNYISIMYVLYFIYFGIKIYLHKLLTKRKKIIINLSLIRF